VFEVIKAPYGQRVPRAVAQKPRIIERGSDMVLAAHDTPLRGRLKATTVETVRFYPPDRVDFKLVRGPVPHEKPNAGQRRNRAALRPAAAPIVMISILLPPLPTSGPPACACRFSSSNTRAASARRA
jgi:hypothetical protein